MTANQFEEIWNKRYASAPPISYFLRDTYPERWFRIHSLPESKRYPENDSDWNILLNRQNTIIGDLLHNDLDILLVTGEYDISSNNKHRWQVSPRDSIQHLLLTELKPIPLKSLNDEYDLSDFYRPVFSKIYWQPSIWNKLLKEIAKDEFRAFFISINNELIIAPYDGGVDIILKDNSTRDIYKAKYKDWLSGREDGL